MIVLLLLIESTTAPRNNNMTYQEAAQDSNVVTKQEALNEVSKHSISIDEFIAENGNHETYKSSKVLAWLGY